MQSDGKSSPCLWSKLAISIEDLPYMLPTKFRFIWPSGFRGEDLKKSANQKQEMPVVAKFVTGTELNDHSLEELP